MEFCCFLKQFVAHTCAGIQLNFKNIYLQQNKITCSVFLYWSVCTIFFLPRVTCYSYPVNSPLHNYTLAKTFIKDFIFLVIFFCLKLCIRFPSKAYMSITIATTFHFCLVSTQLYFGQSSMMASPSICATIQCIFLHYT